MRKKNFLLYFVLLFPQRQKCSKSLCKACTVYKYDVLMTHKCERWFAKFHSGGFDVNDACRSGWPLEADDDEIKTMAESNP